MTSELERELAQALRESQSKYTYFLLAAAGAAIGFALTQTKGASLNWYQVPLGLGVLCWAISFYYGCRYVRQVHSGLHVNLIMVKTQHDIRSTVQFMETAKKAALETMEGISDTANTFSNWQFRFLIAGAVLYILWHVLEMYLRG